MKREREKVSIYKKAEKQREGVPLALRRAAAPKGSASDQLVPELSTLARPETASEQGCPDTVSMAASLTRHAIRTLYE